VWWWIWRWKRENGEGEWKWMKLCDVMYVRWSGSHVGPMVVGPLCTIDIYIKEMQEIKE
jgi:hypothetical protein